MKWLLGVIMVGTLGLTGMCFYKTCKENHRLVRTVKKTLALGFAAILFNLTTMFDISELTSLISYSAYFIVIDWLLYYLFKFSIEYIGNEFDNHVNRKLMIATLLVDSASLVLNIFLNHLFSLERVIIFDDSPIYKMKINPLYYTHYGIVLLLVVFCLISLFYRTITAPAFYRMKYLIIAVILMVIFGVNISTLNWAIDISVLGYAIEGICIYYCAFVYTPQKLLPKTLFKVAQDMMVALFVLDMDGKKLYANKYAGILLDEALPLVDRYGTTLEDWCRMEYLNSTDEFTKERSFYRRDEETILKIQLQRMRDDSKQLQGGYFMIQDRTEEINNLKKEKYLSMHDSLTGLYNKAYFYEKAENYIKKNPDEELLMICIDIKGFKLINDSLGTKTGDSILIKFSDKLRSRVKKAVAYGRIENDVFAVLMPKKYYDEEAAYREERKAFMDVAKTKVSFPIITYVGIYEIVEPDLPASVMCDRARMAISYIKGDFYKRIAYYDMELRDSLLHEQELINELPAAMAENQLKMYIQPQMNANGELLGGEALVRWIHPEKGYIVPGRFIPVFEKNGLISDVDKFIWECACKKLSEWKEKGREDLHISVNISSRDFYFLNVYQIFTDLIEKYQINRKNLKLEITETAIMMNFEQQMELIQRLRKEGFVVEMDDFGSGYSSLNMLKDLQVDVLKIDMEFLRQAEDKERSRMILELIIGLSKQLGMPVVTEGVETEEQVKMLAGMGCDIFQGYYFAKPMPIEEFEAKYIGD